MPLVWRDVQGEARRSARQGLPEVRAPATAALRDGERARAGAHGAGSVEGGTRHGAVSRHRAVVAAVTQDEYDAMLARQDGHCALCPSTPKTRRLHIDHDHRTGEIRGLLCHRCNRNLPAWVDALWLARASAYLQGVPVS